MLKFINVYRSGFLDRGGYFPFIIRGGPRRRLALGDFRLGPNFRTPTAIGASPCEAQPTGTCVAFGCAFFRLENFEGLACPQLLP